MGIEGINNNINRITSYDMLRDISPQASAANLGTSQNGVDLISSILGIGGGSSGNPGIGSIGGGNSQFELYIQMSQIVSGLKQKLQEYYISKSKDKTGTEDTTDNTDNTVVDDAAVDDATNAETTVQEETKIKGVKKDDKVKENTDKSGIDIDSLKLDDLVEGEVANNRVDEYDAKAQAKPAIPADGTEKRFRTLKIKLLIMIPQLIKRKMH